MAAAQAAFCSASPRFYKHPNPSDAAQQTPGSALAFQREYAEDPPTHAAQRLAADEPFQPFDAERKLAQGQ